MIRSVFLATLVSMAMMTAARAESRSAPEAIDPAHPWQLHAYRIYGFGISSTPMPSPAQLAEMGVNLTIAGGGFNFGTARE